jgi:hypothetical protein
MTQSRSPTHSQQLMTGSKPSDDTVREALDLSLQDEQFIKALAAAIGREYGLGENPKAFFDRFIKKAARYLGFGGGFEAQVLPMVYASEAHKQLAGRRNDLTSLEYSLEVARRRVPAIWVNKAGELVPKYPDAPQHVTDLEVKVASCKARIKELEDGLARQEA